ncbi:MAG: 16S rRNA (uracil(1498)-N(3))-methyltransferase [Asticcacaulis sp.]|uniref:16S rRNA (uracil(1498)-N(3))-methyltransferase n=1 Tax=Asticcacaulis sp. TaxID=1872648 RepID=UPI003F7C37EA
MVRLYIAETTPVFAPGLKLALHPDQGRYLVSVMRRAVGDELCVFNGRDGEWRARISDAGKKAVTLELVERTREQTAPGDLALAVALIKRAALEYIIEKATELGVARIQLLITRRSNADHTRVERLTAIAREAAEQTERLDVPDILPPLKLDAWLAQPGAGTLIFGDEDSTHEGHARATPPLLQALADSTAPITVLIGPEGGFDETERATLRSLPNVRAVNLGPRILRADTAAIAALTLCQAAVGDWR